MVQVLVVLEYLEIKNTNHHYLFQLDDIDEKLTENRSWQNETYDYDNEKDGEDDEEEEHNKGANANGDSGSVHQVPLKETDTY